MSYSEQAAALSQHIVRAADHPTRVRAALDLIRKLDVGAEVTQDDDGVIIYIPRTR